MYIDTEGAFSAERCQLLLPRLGHMCSCARRLIEIAASRHPRIYAAASALDALAAAVLVVPATSLAAVMARCAGSRCRACLV
jgi:hypothetical protein